MRVIPDLSASHCSRSASDSIFVTSAAHPRSIWTRLISSIGCCVMSCCAASLIRTAPQTSASARPRIAERTTDKGESALQLSRQQVRYIFPRLQHATIEIGKLVGVGPTSTSADELPIGCYPKRVVINRVCDTPSDRGRWRNWNS